MNDAVREIVDALGDASYERGRLAHEVELLRFKNDELAKRVQQLEGRLATQAEAKAS